MGDWLTSFPSLFLSPSSLCPSVNEAWFGLNGLDDCTGVQDYQSAHRLSVLKPRPVLGALHNFFGESRPQPAPMTCAQLQPCWQCSIDQGREGVVAGKCNSQCGMSFGLPTVWGKCAPYVAHGAESVAFDGPLTTLFTGSVGVAPGSSIVGNFEVRDGTTDLKNVAAVACQADKQTIFDTLAGLTCPAVNQLKTADLSGRTFLPGVYCRSEMIISAATVTLDGAGDPNAQWVFQTASSLVTATATSLRVMGAPCGWVPGTPDAGRT